MTELEKMELAECYINRYFEIADGVEISKENKEYLKIYIRDVSEAEREFDFNGKRNKSMLYVLGGALVFALLLLIAFHSGLYFIVPVLGFLTIAVSGYMIINKYYTQRLVEVRDHQKEVNEGITEQIEILQGRIRQLEKQRDDYLTALRKKIDFMELDMDYMNNIGQIKEFMVNGEAETCEEAVQIFESNLLMQQMSGIMSASVHDKTMDIEKNKERFGDPTKDFGKKPAKKSLFGKK
ncbi:MAG: hypothetical protein J5582_02810 [Ruminococcus sp.]|uniref:Uncharacterized protein n=1 Tax=Ruminococcus albus TaxID=1264 RepID=A0A1H7GC71_RUMAL|nr:MULTISPECIES: hypothetical protein [Ruminococcus]MBO4865491.1 hypothetical protein [Ruminococcus sp.]SEK35876.1 hypothetical protein SAMN05216469_10255 [Ruminococcus albus]